MGRPRKSEQLNENETPQFMPPVDENGNDILPEGVEETNQKIVPLIASEDIPLHKGGVLVPTLICLRNGMQGLITSTADNAANGLLVEDGKRLPSSFVVSSTQVVDGDVHVIINVCDDVTILRQTQYGTRMDNLIIPAGTHVADLVLL